MGSSIINNTEPQHRLEVTYSGLRVRKIFSKKLISQLNAKDRNHYQKVIGLKLKYKSNIDEEGGFYRVLRSNI